MGQSRGGDDGMAENASKTAGEAGKAPFANEQGPTLAGPFWEDVLACPARPLPTLTDVAAAATDPYTDLPSQEPQRFVIGEVPFRATGVCRRCVVPSRHSRTGRLTALFRDAFEARRYRGLRQDVDTRDWQDYYRLGLNTSVVRSPTGGQITIGDELKLLETP